MKVHIATVSVHIGHCAKLTHYQVGVLLGQFRNILELLLSRRQAASLTSLSLWAVQGKDPHHFLGHSSRFAMTCASDTIHAAVLCSHRRGA